MTHSWSLASLKRRVAWNRHLGGKTQSHVCVCWSFISRLLRFTHRGTHTADYLSILKMPQHFTNFDLTQNHQSLKCELLRTQKHSHTRTHMHTLAASGRKVGVEGGGGWQWRMVWISGRRMWTADRVPIGPTIDSSVWRFALGWSAYMQTDQHQFF